MVAQVQAGSAAARAGVQVGDFVLKVGGRDTRDWEGEAVLRVFKESVGTAVEVRVARPSPIPVTDKEKRRALIVLQTKVSGDGNCSTMAYTPLHSLPPSLPPSLLPSLPSFLSHNGRATCREKV